MSMTSRLDFDVQIVDRGVIREAGEVCIEVHDGLICSVTLPDGKEYSLELRYQKQVTANLMKVLGGAA